MKASPIGEILAVDHPDQIRLVGVEGQAEEAPDHDLLSVGQAELFLNTLFAKEFNRPGIDRGIGHRAIAWPRG
ncbi:MAG: hypothetical protein NVSMB9_25810 [Isosphaeraceae bacterium]